MKVTLIISSLLASTALGFQAASLATRSSSGTRLYKKTNEIMNSLNDIKKNYYKKDYKTEETYDDVLLELNVQTARLGKIQAAVDQGLDAVPTAAGLSGLSGIKDEWAKGTAYTTQKFSNIGAELEAKKKEVAELKKKLESFAGKGPSP